MKLYFLLVTALLFLEAVTADAATISGGSPQIASNGRLGVFDFLTKIPGDYVRVFHSVFQSSSIPPFSGVAASTGTLIKYDYELWKPLHNELEEDESFRHVARFGANLGYGGSQFYLAGGFLTTGAFFGSHRALRTGSQIVEAVLATGSCTQILKHIIGRQSPDSVTSRRTGRWQFFTKPRTYHKHVSAYDAFPSGHIATALSTVEVIRRNYPETSWIPYIGYPLVAYVGVGMVATSGHWWSDFPLSIFLGWHFARAVTQNNPPEEGGTRQTKTYWNLDFYSPVRGSQGLLLSRTF